MNQKSTVRDFLEQGNVAKALEVWQGWLFDSDPVYKNIILLKSQYKSILESQISGLLTDNEVKAKRSGLIDLALILLDQWNPGGDKSVLQKEIEQLNVDSDSELGIIHLVNCNRHEGVKKFRRNFNNRKESEQKSHFYFIAACRDERPDSFSKRLIYQLIEEELSEEQGSINYPYKEGLDFIKIVNLPWGSDLASSQKKMRKYLAERFDINDYTGHIDNFFESGLNQLTHQYIVSIFDISEKEWNGDSGEISEYFRWLIEVFKNRKKDGPTFIFFIIVYINKTFYDRENLTSKQKEILRELETLYQDGATLLTELSPVESIEIEDWLACVSIRNPNTSRKLINALAHGLTPAERNLFEQSSCLHMKDVEVLQRMVFDYLNR